MLNYELKHTSIFKHWVVITRGGVRDTRLEAKAKDTKKSEAMDSPTKDRPSRSQGQECSRPRTQAQVLSKKIIRRSPKKGLQKKFQAIYRKKRFPKNFSGASQTFNNSKIVREQDNFRGLEASRPRPRTWPSRPRTSKYILKAKDVLEDSTTGNYILFTKLPWPGDSEGTFCFLCQAATCPPVCLTRRRLHTVPLIAVRQAGICNRISNSWQYNFLNFWDVNSYQQD